MARPIPERRPPPADRAARPRRRAQPVRGTRARRPPAALADAGSATPVSATTGDVREIARTLARIEGARGRVNRPLVRALGEHCLLAFVLPVEGRPSSRGLCRMPEAL